MNQKDRAKRIERTLRTALTDCGVTTDRNWGRRELAISLSTMAEAVAAFPKDGVIDLYEITHQDVAATLKPGEYESAQKIEIKTMKQIHDCFDELDHLGAVFGVDAEVGDVIDTLKFFNDRMRAKGKRK